MNRKIKKVKYFLTAKSAHILYKYPQDKIKVIFVTGTNGKTTTASMIYSAINSSSKKASLLTTLGAKFSDGKNIDTGLHTTTPSASFIHKFINNSIKTKHDYAVIEVSSHAIDQYRVYGIIPSVSVYTNISKEHLDYHKTFENYRATKAKLIEITSDFVILNQDDSSFEYLKSICKKHKKRYLTYGLNSNANVYAQNINLSQEGVKFLLKWSNLKFDINLKAIGEFNIYNLLAAFSTGIVIKLNGPLSVKGLEKFTLPKGRMQIIQTSPFLVIIDFAHTIEGLNNALSSVKAVTKGKVISMFGSESERYSAKRKDLGKVASSLADFIVLTSDDPRFEDPKKIMKEIEEGMDKNKFKINENLFEIENREKAIEFILTKLAKEGDTVLFSGKGHEKSISIKGKELRWDEERIVKKYLGIS